MQDLTHTEVDAMAQTVEFTAADIAQRFQSVAEGTVSDVWFTLNVQDDDEFTDVVQAILNDSDVRLHKAEREDGFVSARHVDYTPEK